MKKIRYTEVCTESCDHYFIPVSKLLAFEEWETDVMENDGDCTPPEYAVLIDGGRLTFTDPKIERL